MRLSKKMLREAKNGLQKRLKEILSLDDEPLQAEYVRCFPEVPSGSVKGMRKTLALDVIDLAFPEHWFA